MSLNFRTSWTLHAQGCLYGKPEPAARFLNI